MLWYDFDACHDHNYSCISIAICLDDTQIVKPWIEVRLA